MDSTVSRTQRFGRTKGPTVGRTIGVAVVLVTVLRLTVLTNAAGAQQTEPGVVVRHVVHGTERTAGVAYRFELRCERPGASGSATPVGQPVEFTLTPNVERRFGTNEISGMQTSDRCSVSTVFNDGGETTYASSNPLRADGTRADDIPGIVGPNGYRSAWTPADGRSITAVTVFGGDLLLSKQIEGPAPIGSAVFEVRVLCDGGYDRSVLLSDGQQQVLTGIPAGSICKVTETRTGGAAPRYADNSGSPGDGTVTIIATTSACWDLRNQTPECRAAVTITNVFTAQTDTADESNGPPTTTGPTTTNPDNTATTAAPVAPAPVEEPQQLAEEEATIGDVAFTG
jgi:hypothetical protein